MRLWHKDLVPWLPTQQLISQWRECCAIAKNIVILGTPNRILVNKVMDYPICHFYHYTNNVKDEMSFRGYHITSIAYDNFITNIKLIDPVKFDRPCTDEDIFEGWHNERYLIQCVSNLEEKFDCGGISEEDFYNILDQFSYILY